MKTIYCCTAAFVVVAFLSVTAQTVNLSGSTTGIVPCTNVTYTVTGVPALGSAGTTQGSKVESIEYIWNLPVGGVYTSGFGPTSSQATIRWDQTSNGFTKMTGRVTVKWKDIIRDNQGRITREDPRTPPAIESKIVQVLHLGSINGIVVGGNFVTNSTTVECGVRDIILSVTPPATDPSSTVTYSWTLPATWTLLAQGGTGGGQTSRVTVRTDLRGSGIVQVRASRPDATTTGCPAEFQIVIGRPTPVVPAFTSPNRTICPLANKRYTVTSAGATGFEWEVSAGLGINGTTGTALASTANFIDVAATQPGNFNGTIRVRATRGQCGVSDWSTLSVGVGTATVTGFTLLGSRFNFGSQTSFFSVCPEDYLTYWPITDFSGDITGYEWQVTGSPPRYLPSLTSQALGLQPNAQPNTLYVVRLRLHTACGPGPWFESYDNIMNCAGGEEPFRTPVAKQVLAYPNPASDMVEVNLTEGETAEATLINRFGLPVRFAKSENGGIKVADLPSGLYILRVKKDGKFHSQSIQVSH